MDGNTSPYGRTGVPAGRAAQSRGDAAHRLILPGCGAIGATRFSDIGGTTPGVDGEPRRASTYEEGSSSRKGTR